MRLVPNISNEDALNGKSDHIPLRQEIPKEFWGFGRETKWKDIYYRWFYEGLPEGTVFVAKPDINRDAAMDAIYAIMNCRKPEANHKSAACSFLLSEWFEDVKIP